MHGNMNEKALSHLPSDRLRAHALSAKEIAGTLFILNLLYYKYLNSILTQKYSSSIKTSHEMVGFIVHSRKREVK